MTQVLPKERAREYESIFILHPESQADVVDSVSGRCQDVISRLNGKLVKAENWGRRKLAYPVKKNAKGIYIYLRYLGYYDLVHELERNLRAMDPVIKFLTVKIDEDVNPEARPVSDEDISFEAKFDDADEPEDAEIDDADEQSSDADATSNETGDETDMDDKAPSAPANAPAEDVNPDEPADKE